MPKHRLESLSDGVYAIALTLLVFDLRLPLQHTGGLQHALADAWPAYLAYLLSFVMLSIGWVGHHSIVHVVKWVDQATIMLNLHVLLWIAVVPFPTTLVAQYLTRGDDARTAVVVYSSVMLLSNVATTIFWTYLVGNPERIDWTLISPEQVRASTRFSRIGLCVSAFTVGVSILNPVAALVVHFVLATLYIVGNARVRMSAADEARVAS